MVKIISLLISVIAKPGQCFCGCKKCNLAIHCSNGSTCGM